MNIHSFINFWHFKRPIRIIIFGIHSPDWMEALDANADLWTKMPSIKEVIHIPDNKTEIPEPKFKFTKTVIIPLMENHTLNCPHKFYSLFPNAQALNIFSKKNIYHKYIANNNLDTLAPRIYLRIEDVIYPAVLKRLDLNGGQGIFVINSYSELIDKIRQNIFLNQRFLLEELIPGNKDYVTHCVCKNGLIVWQTTFLFKMRGQREIRGPHNPGDIEYFNASKKTLREIESILIPLQYSGPCNIDYRITPDGKVKVFEINPRLGGTLMYKDNIYLLAEAIKAIVSFSTKH